MAIPPNMSLAVVGAAHKNADGSDRLEEIMRTEPGEQVVLVPEPENPHDRYAIAVYTMREVKIGYLSAERAPRVHAWMQEDNEIAGVFQRPTSFGAWIRVAFDGQMPELTPAMLKDHDDEPARPTKGKAQEPDFYPDEV